MKVIIFHWFHSLCCSLLARFQQIKNATPLIRFLDYEGKLISLVKFTMLLIINQASTDKERNPLIRFLDYEGKLISLVIFTMFLTITQASTDKERNTLIRFLDNEGN